MILLNIDGAARPGRTEPRSSRATDRALSIRSSASSRVSSITGSLLLRRLPPYWPGGVAAWAWTTSGDRRPYPVAGGSDRLTDQGADLLTCDRACDVAVLEQVEHDDRHAVVHAEADRGRVGDPELLGQDRAVVQVVVHRGGGVGPRVVVVDAVDAVLGHEQHLAADLQ